MFYSNLHLAIVNSNYWNIILKPEQVECLAAMCSVRDTVGMLSRVTGGRLFSTCYRVFSLTKSTPSSSLIYPVVIIVSLLNLLISVETMREQMSDRPAWTACVVLVVAWYHSLRVRFKGTDIYVYY